MSSLPPDLTPDILAAGLPVKDLLRFRCVSSSWRSLIDSPYFAKLHLSRSQKTSSNLFLLDIDMGRIRSLGFESLEKDPEILQLPPIESPDRVAIADSCDGVVALYNLTEEDVTLWNPSTRKLRKLPSSKIIAGNPGFYRQKVACGFGYDSEMDDYKLVRIAQLTKGFSSVFSKAEVFTLKMDTWREIECPYLVNDFIYTQSAALLNNALHWVINSQPPDVNVVAFGLVKEEFYVVPRPDCNPEVPQVGVLGGCLSMAFNHKYSPPFALDVWVMKEYGVKETWSKLLFLPLIHTTMYPRLYVSPIAYSKDRKRILLNYSGQLTWYDLTTKALDFLDAFVVEPALCMESLVALD